MRLLIILLLILNSTKGKAQDSSRMNVSIGTSLFYLTSTKPNHILIKNTVRAGFGGLVQQKLKRDLYLSLKFDVLPHFSNNDRGQFLIITQAGITKRIHQSRFTGSVGTGIGNFLISADYTYAFSNGIELSSGLCYSFKGILGYYANARLDLSELFGKIYGF